MRKLTAAQSAAIAKFFESNPSFKSDMIIGWVDFTACLLITWDDFKCVLKVSETGELDGQIV
jgi:hypothetical protein